MKSQSYRIELPSGNGLSLAYDGDNLLEETPEARAFVDRIVRMMERAKNDGFAPAKRKAQRR